MQRENKDFMGAKALKDEILQIETEYTFFWGRISPCIL